MPDTRTEPAAGQSATTPVSVVSLPRHYVAASVATLVLAAVAAAVGLFVPGFYRDAAPLVPELHGQDLLTLVVAVPALAVSLYFAAHGSLRAYVVWLGIVGYLLYVYASYAFLTAFNELYLVYVALFSLTLFTLIGGLVRFDAARLKRAIGDRSVRPYVVFEVVLAVLLAALWLSDDVPAILRGGVPARVAETGIPVNVIHSLDLGVVVPSFLLAAYLLWRGRPIGYAVTGVLLVKGATLGMPVLSMIVFMVRDGQAVPLPQVVIFTALTLAALALMARFVRAIDADSVAAEPDRVTPTDRPVRARAP